MVTAVFVNLIKSIGFITFFVEMAFQEGAIRADVWAGKADSFIWIGRAGIRTGTSVPAYYVRDIFKCDSLEQVFELDSCEADA